MANEDLKTNYDIDNIYRFLDCCAGQYRGYKSFADLSLMYSTTKVQHHYFEPSHGKSAADRLAAVVKDAACKATTRREAIIRNAIKFLQLL